VDDLGPTISDAVAANMREVRKRRGWKIADLAARCQALGGGAESLTENVIENIESGRRRNGERTRQITVDELTAIAAALSVPPAYLMPELAEQAGDMVPQFGLEEAEAGLQSALDLVQSLKGLRTPREQESGDDGPR
jgi:transcriptional regulator with XRE-family HTH domain